MTLDERETHILYDYRDKVVTIYTTEKRIVDFILKRSKGITTKMTEDKVPAWTFKLAMTDCRRPDLIIKPYK